MAACIASGSGTPAFIIAEMIRQNRSMTAYRTTSPINGMRRKNRSLVRFPRSVFRNSTVPMTIAAPPPMMAYHHCWVKSEKSSSSCVGRGSLASNSLKNAMNRGITNPTRITTVTIAMMRMIAG